MGERGAEIVAVQGQSVERRKMGFLFLYPSLYNGCSNADVHGDDNGDGHMLAIHGWQR